MTKRTWLHTRCDSCMAAGLVGLVPLDSSGNMLGREFPSLCPLCFKRPKERQKIEDRAAQDAGELAGDIT